MTVDRKNLAGGNPILSLHFADLSCQTILRIGQPEMQLWLRKRSNRNYADGRV